MNPICNSKDLQLSVIRIEKDKSYSAKIANLEKPLFQDKSKKEFLVRLTGYCHRHNFKSFIFYDVSGIMIKERKLRCSNYSKILNSKS